MEQPYVIWNLLCSWSLDIEHKKTRVRLWFMGSYSETERMFYFSIGRWKHPDMKRRKAGGSRIAWRTEKRRNSYCWTQRISTYNSERRSHWGFLYYTKIDIWSSLLGDMLKIVIKIKQNYVTYDIPYSVLIIACKNTNTCLSFLREVSMGLIWIIS